MTRLWLTLAAVVFFELVVWGMRIGWRHRAQRQGSLSPLPSPPAATVGQLLPAATGLYVGTTYAERWQDRVVAQGLGRRAACTATLSATGLLVDRHGDEPVWIPAGELIGAGLGRGLAGKVMGPGGLLIVRWRSGDAELDTGLRFDDKRGYPDWIGAIDRLTAGKMIT